MMSFAEDADPRFSTKPSETDEKGAKKAASMGKKKKPARIAFTGEEWGFGYQATKRFLELARDRKNVPDAGFGAMELRVEREFDEASKNNGFDYLNADTQPLRTKEQALMAVQQNTADFAIVPFYNPYSGYDFESLRAVASLSRLRGVQQVEASDHYCLAVHETQLFDIMQSSHPGSAFSALQRRMRKSWGGVDAGSGNMPGGEAGYDGEIPRAGLPIDMADQKLIRDRIDVVFAGPEAARRCKSKLDGLRALGIETREISAMIEPHRELAKLARSNVSANRQTTTMYDAGSGEIKLNSILGADSQNTPLFAMVLPYEVAMRSSDYQIIDHNFEQNEPQKTRFMVVENNPDHTLYEDRYRTTDAKTSYWTKRLATIANPTITDAIPAGVMRFLGMAVGSLAILLLAFGIYGLSASVTSLALPSGFGWLSSLTTGGMIAAGVAAALAAFVMLSSQATGSRGVRVMFLFRRDKTAASIGDVEDYLRNYGVRHTVVRVDEDSNRDAPASIVLDVEFDPSDFKYGIFAMLSRRLRGSVVNGAVKKTFQRWKNRGVTILAAMPFEPEQAQLPKHQPRRWWSEAVGDWFADATETWFIRLSRILMFYVLPAAAVAFILVKLMNG
jgi:prephenate dehydratase